MDVYIYLIKSITVFRSYLTLALRNFKRHKSFTIINVIGLALGICCALLIYLLVNLHTSFDQYHRQADNTFRLVTDIYFGDILHTPGVPIPLAEAIKEEIPQVEKITAYSSMSRVMIAVEKNGKKKKYKDDDVAGAFVQPAFFDIFDYTWKQGEPAALEEPNTVAISEKVAEMVFGQQNPVGEQMKIDNEETYTVVGVLERIPENTDFRSNVFCSYSTLEKQPYWKENKSNWGSVSSDDQCFATLAKGYSKSDLDQALISFNDKYHEVDKGKRPSGQNAWATIAQPIKDRHFDTNYDGLADYSLIWALTLVGLLMIITASINFINIATAQALTRSKEVGVRKVVGGTKGQLFRQFMMETGVIVFFSVLLACALVKPTLPYLSELVMSDIQFNLLSDQKLWLFLLLTFVVVTLLSGVYPALVLTGFEPAVAVKGRVTSQSLGGFNVRRALVVGQFAISQLLIIGALVMTAQLDFMKKTDLGFNKDAVVVLDVPEQDKVKMQTLKNRLVEIKGVDKLSFSGTTPASGSNNSTNIRFEGRQEDEEWQITTRPADDHFLDVYDIQLIAGRNLNPSDTIREYLLNETAMKKMGINSPDEIIGKSIDVWGYDAPVVGIVKDYFTSSLVQDIKPVCIMTHQRQYYSANLKVNTQEIPKTLASIEKIWQEMYPDHFYEYDFLDERLEGFYQMESILLTLIRSFCGIAILIGCLGLYGLVTFIVARRLKEIGVRKVLGASISSILGIFGKEFAVLIGIAFLIAAPLGYFAMSGYLQDYAYAIELGVGTFMAAIVLTGFIAMVTVGWHSFKAAKVNPAEVLKSE